MYGLGTEDGSYKGWIEVEEIDATRVFVKIRNGTSYTKVAMLRDDAKTFAGQLLHIASKDRS